MATKPTRWLLWRRSQMGPPTPAVLTTTNLDEYDRKNKLGKPIALSPEEEFWDLEALVKRYPCPADAEAIPRT